MNASTLVVALLVLPLLAAVACFALRDPRGILRVVAGVTAVILAGALLLAWHGLHSAAPLSTAGGVLRVDGLASFHVVVLALTYFTSSVFAIAYFRPEIADGHFDSPHARRYGALWLSALSAMLLVLLSNNLGLMWVGMESTTLLTAYLVGMHGGTAIEAMWKYLIVCSVGIAFAFMGTLLSAASVPASAGLAGDSLLWTHLFAVRAQLNPVLMKTAFIFLVVGYGTKAGLAPMHTWLPDAHSQAPAPVSAMFSGFMLNAALYCILRYLPIVEATSPGFGKGMMVGFGLLSILLSAVFIVFQKDAKRLLAYSSVEHLGIMAVGFGLGPLGVAAALFHMLNHSIGKPLAFFSVGRLGQTYGSHDMGRIRGALRTDPIYGPALFGSLLALIGVAPFAIFMSEFQLLRASVLGQRFAVLVLFLLGTGVVFVSALEHGIGMTFGRAPDDVEPVAASPIGRWLSVGSLGTLLVLGLWMPQPLHQMIRAAAQIVEVVP